VDKRYEHKKSVKDDIVYDAVCDPDERNSLKLVEMLLL